MYRKNLLLLLLGHLLVLLSCGEVEKPEPETIKYTLYPLQVWNRSQFDLYELIVHNTQEYQNRDNALAEPLLKRDENDPDSGGRITLYFPNHNYVTIVRNQLTDKDTGERYAITTASPLSLSNSTFCSLEVMNYRFRLTQNCGMTENVATLKGENLIDILASTEPILLERHSNNQVIEIWTFTSLSNEEEETDSMAPKNYHLTRSQYNESGSPCTILSSISEIRQVPDFHPMQRVQFHTQVLTDGCLGESFSQSDNIINWDLLETITVWSKDTSDEIQEFSVCFPGQC